MSEFSGSINDENINGKDKDKEFYEKGIKACKNYLELRGYDIEEVNPDNKIQFIAYDPEDDAMRFIHLRVTDKMNFDEPKSLQPTKCDFENRMLNWYVNAENIGECNIHRDQIVIIACNNDKALLRHHKDAY